MLLKRRDVIHNLFLGKKILQNKIKLPYLTGEIQILYKRLVHYTFLLLQKTINIQGVNKSRKCKKSVCQRKFEYQI